MGKKTVLVVDDTIDNLIILYKVLRSEYEVIGANSGAEALRLVQSTPPDLILLDIMMPEMDGYEVCRLLKQDPLLRDIPVMFITALNEEVDETRGFEAGAVDFINKPIKPAILARRVAVHLELRSQKEALQRRNQELQAALSRVKELSGLLPICMTCKKIRDDQGYWNQLESYISEHSEVLFSHSYCPECAEVAMTDFLK
ncbi:response regulator [Geomonas sp. Red69]|uniref:Response regulator n=1 Tax=Geomonas diazotrophica TaxID=2843197 RepID=A0ABX8JHH0_9BACT|nr:MULTISPECIES: response regulator [Geomonas]MBU5635143.1 response regulator [Geomonas diazotrophica]QWV97810.1 response regulator [Geomonas nitrogeniifigens]QXE86950.1 response regulator [Geomonas nitrogeniifigens]